MLDGRAQIPQLPHDDLAGAHAIACGTGEALTRALTELRTAGVRVSHADDPYALVRQLGSGTGDTTHILLLLTCLFPEELAVVDAIRGLSPHIRILVGSVEGAAGLLAASIRAGVDGIWVGGAIEWLGPPPAARPTTPVATPAAARSEPARLEPRREELTRGNYRDDHDDGPHPLLSQEELRALLGEEPAA